MLSEIERNIKCKQKQKAEMPLCCVCLNFSDKIRQLNVEDETGKSLYSKLQEIEPNQGWHEKLVVCEKCELLLNNSYDFRRLVIEKEMSRTEMILNEINHDTTEDISNDCDKISEIDDDAFEPDEDNKSEVDDSRDLHHCSQCEKTFLSKTALACHVSTIHGISCRLCWTKFRNKKDLNSHIKKQHKSKDKPPKFRCEICSEPFILLKDIFNHYIKTHNIDQSQVKPYWCDICDNKFSSSTLLTQHKKYHEGERIFTCITCGKSFITKRDLTGHEKAHGNQRNYSCDKCDRTFNTSQNLWTHKYVVHTDASEWKYACSVCSKRFAMKSNYREHMQRHGGVKDHSCHICKKNFITRPELQKHVKLHSNISQWKCQKCHRTYRDPRSLKAHLAKTHGMGAIKATSKTKKYVCSICPSQFFYKNKLQRHLRTHSGIKPFSCDQCGKKFTDKSYLTYHFKRVHQE